MVVKIIGPRDKNHKGSYINTTSRSTSWSKGLSPFFLGPVSLPYAPTAAMVEAVNEKLATLKSENARAECQAILTAIHGSIEAKNVENAWQYSKVYEPYDDGGVPSRSWYTWRAMGFVNPRAVRYPMGHGAVPLYFWVDGKRLSYIEARKQLYIPIYSAAVKRTDAFQRLRGLYTAGPLTLWDFDGYDHLSLGMSYNDVMNCETRKMGHTFVLGMMLEGII